MSKRFVSIWLPNLVPEWLSIKRPALKKCPFVFAAPDHGRMIITSANQLAMEEGIVSGMAVADARSIISSLQVFDDKPGRSEKLLKAMAEWCIRYTPLPATDFPDGLLLDVSGCAHLWGGEDEYLTAISSRLQQAGYSVRAAMADTIGAAWAMAHFGKNMAIVESRGHATSLLALPPAALRLSGAILSRLQKLGLNQLSRFIHMPRMALRRRFGEELLLRMDQAMGREEESFEAVVPVVPYEERLHCLEAIATATGIEIALTRLLDRLCSRLFQEEKGLRSALFTAYRLDGKIEKTIIGTNRASYNRQHLFKLFEPGLSAIEPGLGIELFVLEAQVVEEVPAWQQQLWAGSCGLEDIRLSELLDHIANRVGNQSIHRYLPAEHYWPERSIKPAMTLVEKKTIPWQTDRPRPAQLLAKPERIEVTAPVPDYPPMMFRYKGELHTIKKADGPERIEREWWLDKGAHRDYYHVEDEKGQRYWLFRSGHYAEDNIPQWFIHGFFA